jgi:hypothetical protein
MNKIETLGPSGLVMQICDEDFGMQPDNFSIKPVHLANGLARALTGETNDTTALAQTLRRWVRDQRAGVDRESHPTEQILERYPAAFRDGTETEHERVNTLRALARDVLGADDAVFQQADKSSYTLANRRFVSPDPSDNRSGLFVAELLRAGGGGDAEALLLEHLDDDTDPYSTIAGPLLKLASSNEVSAHSTLENAALAGLLAIGGTNGRLQSPILSSLRESFDRLARFERREGSKLNSLRRMVLFGCFVVHVHMTSRWSEVEVGAPRPPILLDMFDGSRLPLRDASRATLRAAGEVLERLLILRLRERLGQLSEESVSRLLDNAQALKKEQQSLQEAYETQRSDPQVTPGEALVQAYLNVAFAGKQPLNFLTELGRRAGYLTPWANQGRGGRTKKRYGASAEFLETLVAATVEPDELLDFGEFLDRLRDSFGVLAGRAQDDDAVHTCDLDGQLWTTTTSIAEEDLRMNVEALRVAVLDTGYGREYADGQTVIASTPESESVR